MSDRTRLTQIRYFELEPIAVTLAEAKSITSLSRSTLYRLIRDQKIRAIKAESRTLFNVQSLRDYLSSCQPFVITGRL